MDSAASSPTSQRDIEAMAAENAALRSRLSDAEQQVQSLTQKLEWFKRQLFGRTSEKRLEIDPAVQPDLLARLGQTPTDTAPVPREQITYERRKKQRREDSVADTGLRFDDSVPVETIVLPPAELDGVSDGEWVTISEKVTHRLAQRPGSYVVLNVTDKNERLLLGSRLTRRALEGRAAVAVACQGCQSPIHLYRRRQRRFPITASASRAHYVVAGNNALV